MHLVFLTPFPDQPGGGRAFNEGLIPALRARGHNIHQHHAATQLPPNATPIIDGLLLPDLEPHLETLVAQDAAIVIHHISARAGQDKSARANVRAIEQRMLPRFRRVIATSAPVAERLTTDFNIPTPLLLTQGLPTLPRSPGSPQGAPCQILAAGVLTPRKGHDRLLQALAGLTDLDWTLTIAGDAQRDPTHAATIAALIQDLNLAQRVTLAPDATAATLEAAWLKADLFALASTWEGYPASIAEALRRGIPVVATNIGEIPALTPMQAGILCPPNDVPTLAKCLRRAICDTALRAALKDGAWQTGQALPGWDHQAALFLDMMRS